MMLTCALIQPRATSYGDVTLVTVSYVNFGSTLHATLLLEHFDQALQAEDESLVVHPGSRFTVVVPSTKKPNPLLIAACLRKALGFGKDAGTMRQLGGNVAL